MALATYLDVEVAIGRPISNEAEIARVEWWLSGFERVIRSKLGDLALLDQDDLLYVEAEAAAAKLDKASQRESSITVAVDDGSVTRRFENKVTADDITSDLWALLSPVGSGSSAYSIGVTSPRDLP